MIELNLAGDEIELMREVLEIYLSDLRMEIADTDRLEFRERLKERKHVIVKVLDALPVTAQASL